MINSSIFREYDIRGIAGKDLNEDLAYRLGLAYMDFLRERGGSAPHPTISVGRDCRLTGEAYSAALMAGLMDGGAKVINLGMVTTPMTYFSLHHLGLDGAIMVTGSHNPADYNGFKICAGKNTLFGSDIQVLHKIILGQPISKAPGDFKEKASKAESLDIFPQYLNFISKNVHLPRKLKIVVDCGNGAASNFATEVYRLLGCEVIELFCEPDGTFPNHPADPTVESNLQDIIAAVKKHGADAGLAFDGDADRIGVVDNTGRILWGDELMILLSRSVLKDFPGATIISEVKSSHRLYNDINAKGGNGIMWKTGHSLIKAKMKETHAKLAGEMSGHIFFADRFFGFDDGIYAGARFLEILSSQENAASTLLSDVPKTVNTPEIRVDCDDALKWGIVSKITEAMKLKYKVNDIDGARVEFGDGWGLVRASNTQPVIVMRFEAETEARLKEIRKIMETAAVACGLSL